MTQILNLVLDPIFLSAGLIKRCEEEFFFFFNLIQVNGSLKVKKLNIQIYVLRH